MKILIIGCGFLGTRIAEILKNEATLTITKTQPPPSVAQVHFEILKPSIYSKLSNLVKSFDTIIVTVSAGKYDYRTSYICLARALKKALISTKDKTLIYTSSTGVYKESNGGFVSENSQLDLDQSHILIETEKTYLSLINTRVIIFRLSGLIGKTEKTLYDIYARYKNRALYPKYSNFIFVEDAAYAIKYGIEHPIRGIYNLSSFTEKNTNIFKKLFHQEPVIGSIIDVKHGGSKKVVTEKIKIEPFFKITTYTENTIA